MRVHLRPVRPLGFEAEFEWADPLSVNETPVDASIRSGLQMNHAIRHRFAPTK
jgi:hypothetical protein